ncbi:MAG: hypothetical protein ACPGJV_02295 [Bacteriovoracaceae bacterium]
MKTLFFIFMTLIATNSYGLVQCEEQLRAGNNKLIFSKSANHAILYQAHFTYMANGDKKWHVMESVYLITSDYSTRLGPVYELQKEDGNGPTYLTIEEKNEPVWDKKPRGGYIGTKSTYTVIDKTAAAYKTIMSCSHIDYDQFLQI